MTQVKICGLRPGDDLSFTRHPSVTHIGVVFVPASRRYVAPAAARAITAAARDCRVLGVFVDEPVHVVREVIQTAGLHGCQLHGNEPPEVCAALRADGWTVWKALSVPPAVASQASVLADLVSKAAVYAPCVDALLFDAAPPQGAAPGVTGGHGQPWAWDVLPALVAGIARRVARLPAVWVAGGLNAKTIPNLLRVFRPDGIDVSSGAEVDGRKSLPKVNEILEVVNRFDAAERVP